MTRQKLPVAMQFNEFICLGLQKNCHGSLQGVVGTGNMSFRIKCPTPIKIGRLRIAHKEIHHK